MKEIEINKQLPVITINFEEVKASLEENMDKYKGIVVTEDRLKDCKATQKDLAGLRNRLDTYRKDVKKEMEKPIKAFEGQCKELIALIEEVETPIKAGITEFDNKRREAKRMAAQVVILDHIEKLGLEGKYSSQLTILDKYFNLSASTKSVVEDIEQRAEALKQQQDMEKTNLEMLKATIETTIENVNKTISTSLQAGDFFKYIGMGFDTTRIIREINDRAALVKEAEKPKEVVKSKEEEVIQTPVELERVEPVKDDTKPGEESLFFVDVYIEHNYKMIQALSEYLKDNCYKYEVKSKGKK